MKRRLAAILAADLVGYTHHFGLGVAMTGKKRTLEKDRLKDRLEFVKSNSRSRKLWSSELQAFPAFISRPPWMAIAA